jgi:MOB kinase activator 1
MPSPVRSNTLPEFLFPPNPPICPFLPQDIACKCCVSHVYGDSNAKTARGPFRPRNTNKGTSSYQLRQYAEATLGSGSLRKAVKLPEGEDLNEWLAVNGLEHWYPESKVDYTDVPRLDLVVDFYNQINLLYGSITEFCSPQSCPEMKATDESVFTLFPN